MAICDLSTQNPNVLYELGIRQAFNKPITLIKDSLTKRIFDIQGFRDYEYDENLRIDKVVDDVDKLSEIIKSTYEEDGKDINSLISLLSMSPAKLESNNEISNETKLILKSISNIDKRLYSLEEEKTNQENLSSKFMRAQSYRNGPPIGSYELDDTKYDFPSNVGNRLSRKEIYDLEKGDAIYHNRFRFGTIMEIEKHPKTGETKGLIKFDEYGEKKLLLNFARLYKVL